MTPRLGALVLFASDLDRTVAFYRLIGLPLDIDVHEDDGPVHYACDFGDFHFAVFSSDGDGVAPGFGKPGSSFPGFVVEDVSATLDSMRSFGAKIIQDPSPYPWGLRIVVEDPDGRPVEVYQPFS